MAARVGVEEKFYIPVAIGTEKKSYGAGGENVQGSQNESFRRRILD